MSSKYPNRQDKPYLVKRKRRALINIILMSLAITPFLIGFINTYVIEIFYPAYSEIFSLLFTFGRAFTLIMMIPIGTFLLISSVNYHKRRKMLKNKLFMHSRLDNSILQFLIENPGTKFTVVELLNDLKPEEGMDGLKNAMDRLIKLKLISTEVKDVTSYYFMSVKNLKRA